jgi:hypothetical protein
LGQQIGSQMADNTRDLKFKANDIESKKLGVERNEFKTGNILCTIKWYLN